MVDANEVQRLRKIEEAARALVDQRMATYRHRGREIGIEADDGEKCWIVHSDQMFELEHALDAPAAKPVPAA